VTARRAVAFTSVPLEDVHRLRATAGATVNDLALALVGGALRRWLAARGELPHRSLVAMVPVSVRGGDDEPGGNRTSALLTTLATDCPDAPERLARVARVTSAAKRRHDETGVGELVRLADLVPPGPNAWLARHGGSRPPSRRGPLPFNVVVSNVPGPETPFFCCRALLEEAYPMGPLTPWTGLNVTVLSYRDRLSFGLVTCPDVVDDVGGLVAAFGEELDDLDRAVATTHERGA
jgi:WS/DGAT/MGAT family acyltransferase